MRSCYSCAGTEADGCGFPEQRHRPVLCVACLCEMTAALERVPNSARHVQTRRSYRAALRWRERQPQPDMIDMIQPRP